MQWQHIKNMKSKILVKMINKLTQLWMTLHTHTQFHSSFWVSCAATKISEHIPSTRLRSMLLMNTNANEKAIGYWIDASLLFSDSFMSFLFFGSGDCFDLGFPFLLGRRTIVLKDWNQSWRLIRSPCSWARVYLKQQRNTNCIHQVVETSNFKRKLTNKMKVKLIHSMSFN